MTNEEKSILIARACGWAHAEVKPYAFPDYFADTPEGLWACHTAESQLATEEQHWRYMEHIRDQLGHSREFTWSLCHATAPQRAEALYQTLK